MHKIQEIGTLRVSLQGLKPNKRWRGGGASAGEGPRTLSPFIRFQSRKEEVELGLSWEDWAASRFRLGH